MAHAERETPGASPGGGGGAGGAVSAPALKTLRGGHLDGLLLAGGHLDLAGLGLLGDRDVQGEHAAVVVGPDVVGVQALAEEELVYPGTLSIKHSSFILAPLV